MHCTFVFYLPQSSDTINFTLVCWGHDRRKPWCRGRFDAWDLRVNLFPPWLGLQWLLEVSVLELNSSVVLDTLLVDGGVKCVGCAVRFYFVSPDANSRGLLLTMEALCKVYQTSSNSVLYLEPSCPYDNHCRWIGYSYAILRSSRKDISNL